eukprot:gene32546-43480_t
MSSSLISALTFCIFDNEFARIRRAKRDEILNGALPVLVGSICIRVVDAFIAGDILASEIAMRLVFALFGAHVLTYIVVLKTSPDSPNFEYNFSVATEIASFAWNSIITLVVINWLYSTKSLTAALLTWFFLFGFIAAVISFSNYFREVYFPMTEQQKDLILDFESGTFALAMAYSLTVIIAVVIYRNASTDYVAGTDDLNSINDDAATAASAANWWFFLYCALLTGMLLYSPYIDQYIHNTGAKKEGNNEDSVSHSEQVDPNNASSTLSKALLETENKPSCFHSVREYFLGWDKERNTCQRSLVALVEIGFAYMIACAWNLWSALSFQNFFPFEGGMVVGQLIFTAAMLSAILLVSANLYLVKANSNNAEVKEEEEEEEEEAAVVAHSELQPWHQFGGLFYKSSSLSFGWALQTLISVVVAAIVPSGSTAQRPWVVFVVLVIIATAVFFGGRLLYVKLV